MLLTDDNYYDPRFNLTKLSNSGYGQFIKCEAAFMANAERKYEYPKGQAYIQGNLGHTMILEFRKLEQYKRDNPSMFLADGKTLSAKFKVVESAVSAIKQHEFIMDLINAGRKEEILEFKFGGIDWRGKVDVIGDGYILDLKFLSTLQPTEYTQGIHPILYWDYLRQVSLYCWAYNQIYGKYPVFYIACVTKEKEPLINLIKIDHNNDFDYVQMECELLNIHETIPHFKEVVGGEVLAEPCGWCHYCKGAIDVSKPIPLKAIYSETQLKEMAT